MYSFNQIFIFPYGCSLQFYTPNFSVAVPIAETSVQMKYISELKVIFQLFLLSGHVIVMLEEHLPSLPFLPLHWEFWMEMDYMFLFYEIKFLYSIIIIIIIKIIKQ